MFARMNITRSLVRVLGAIAFSGLIAACGTQSPAGSSGAAPRSGPNVNLSGYPQAFKDGFRDGCGSYRRDAARFGKDNDYTLGWQDGYSICGRQQNR